MSHSKIKLLVIVSIIVLLACFAAPSAFATDPVPNEPGVQGQSGSGATSLTMVWENPDMEYGGAGGINNPDVDPADEIGDNLAFTAPTAINFVAKANGELLAPSYSAVYLTNLSAFGIHVSSLQIEQGEGWNIVEDAAASANTANAVWGKTGPYNEKLSWYAYKAKADVPTPAKWGMSATGAAEGKDKLYLSVEGSFANLNKDLSSAQTFGTIHWYVKTGGEGQRAVDPDSLHSVNKPISPTNGSFTVKSSLDPEDVQDLEDAVEGSTVYVVATPSSGYDVSSMRVSESDGDLVPVTTPVEGDDNIGSFTMPDDSVDVFVGFGDGSHYNIMALPTDTGTFFVGTQYDASSGVDVATSGSTLYIIGDEVPYGGRVASVSVTEVATGNEVNVSDKGQDLKIGSFTMPAADVIVKVSYKRNLVTILASGETNLSRNEISMSDFRAMSADLAANSSNPSASQYYDLIEGFMESDTTFVFSDDPNAHPVWYRIIGINHDPAANESGITMMGRRSFTQAVQMFAVEPGETDKGLWEDCDIRAALNTDGASLNQQLPSSVRTYAKTVTKHNNSYDTSAEYSGYAIPSIAGADTQDRFWLISYVEATGKDYDRHVNMDDPAEQLTANKQYEFFAYMDYPYPYEEISANSIVVDGDNLQYEGRSYSLYSTSNDGNIKKYYSNDYDFALVDDNGRWYFYHRAENRLDLNEITRCDDSPIDADYNEIELPICDPGGGSSVWSASNVWLRSSDGKGDFSVFNYRTGPWRYEDSWGGNYAGVCPCFCL